MKSNHPLSHNREVDPESPGYEHFKLQVNDLPAVNITRHQLVRLLSGNNMSVTADGNNITFNASAAPVDSYVHPNKAWANKLDLKDDEVISNLTIDSKGHPTNWTVRKLTPADIGAAPEHNHPYDNYAKWRLQVGTTVNDITTNELVRFISSASNDVLLENGNIVIKRKPKVTVDVSGSSVVKVVDYNDKWMNITGADPTFTVTGTFAKDDEIEGSFSGTGRLTIVGSGITLVYPTEYHQNKIPAGGTFALKFITATKAMLFGRLIPIGI